MQVCNVVEITRWNGRVPARLIEVSYRASQHGLIVLVLRDIAPQTVNSVLDPIVPTLPIDIPGVLYIDVGDEERVQKAVLAAELIFASTAPFRSTVHALGVTPQAVLPANRMFTHHGDHGRGVAERGVGVDDPFGFAEGASQAAKASAWASRAGLNRTGISGGSNS